MDKKLIKDVYQYIDSARSAIRNIEKALEKIDFETIPMDNTRIEELYNNFGLDAIMPYKLYVSLDEFKEIVTRIETIHNIR